MDLKQLRTFRAVAELGSLSKAADRLRSAQPALSRHIKLLEHELRVELFVRNGRGMLLTSAGRMLLDRTTGLIRQIEQVRDDLQSANGSPSGRVILGLVPTVSAVFVRTVRPPRHRRISRYLAAHRRELWRASGRVAAPRRDGSCDHLWPRGRPASAGPVDRPRGHRRGRAAGIGAEQEEAGRPEVAGEAEADPAQHFARPAGAAGEGRRPPAADAQRHDRGRFLSRPDQPDGGRASATRCCRRPRSAPNWRRSGWRWRRSSTRRCRAN